MNPATSGRACIFNHTTSCSLTTSQHTVGRRPAFCFSVLPPAHPLHSVLRSHTHRRWTLPLDRSISSHSFIQGTPFLQPLLGLCSRYSGTTRMCWMFCKSALISPSSICMLRLRLLLPAVTIYSFSRMVCHSPMRCISMILLCSRSGYNSLVILRPANYLI